MSRGLRLSELTDAARSTASLYRLTGQDKKAVSLAPVATPQAMPSRAAPALACEELLALLTIRNTSLAREVAATLKSEGTVLQGTAFRHLRAMGYAAIKPNGYHELTPIGSVRADALAREAARDRGLHLPMFYRSRGHMRERAANGVRCTCGWSVDTGSSGAGLAWQKHLDAVAAQAPFVSDAPGIVPEET